MSKGLVSHPDIVENRTSQIGEMRTILIDVDRTDLAITVVAPDTSAEGVHRHVVDDLCEYEFACVHAHIPPVHGTGDKARARGMQCSSR